MTARRGATGQVETSVASRRDFLVRGACVAAGSLATWRAHRVVAKSLGRPVGIQLYSVKDLISSDPAGTLAQLRRIGFREVETAGFGQLSAKQFRKLLDETGLRCPSAHLQFDVGKLDAAFRDAHTLGATYAASGSLRSLLVGGGGAHAASSGMTLDEAQRTAELANHIGEQARRSGCQYVYHNHDFEFVDQGNGAIGYDLLLRETDAELVKFEIDCGCMILAGRSPLQYLKQNPPRFPMLHIKDFIPDPGGGPGREIGVMRGTELGRGVVDYKPILGAAERAGLQHFFAEQEAPFLDLNPLQAAKVAYEYLHAIG